jgi:hypothetical protein
VDESGRRVAVGRLEVPRIAVNIAKPPDLLGRPH